MTVARDPSAIAAALRGVIEGGERITGVRPMSAGHSNETYVLEGLERVLRLPPSGVPLLGEYDMARQHRIYAALGEQPSAPPVPAVYELVEDAAVLGAPFYVMELCRGETTEWKPPGWLLDATPAQRSAICEQWIDAIARIHQLAAEVVGDPPVDLSEDVGYWHGVALAGGAPARLLSVWDRLRDDVPTLSGPPSCVHGDAKFANFLWADGRLSAVLDWEMSHVGEPLEDLGYLISMLPLGSEDPGYPPFTYLDGWWRREDVIAAWQERTGRSADALPGHELMQQAKIATIFARGVQLFRTGATDDPRFGRWEQALPLTLDQLERRAAYLAAR